MSNIKMIALALAGVLGMMVPHARADEWDQKTIFTFREPVEIPGQVLTAGTYVFKLADSPSNRNIVQVFDKNEVHLYGTFFAIPDYRPHTPERPIITFDERPSGSPEAVRAWYYPGNNYGHEFVYPKLKTIELSREDNQPPAPSEPAAEPAKSTEEPQVVEAPAPVQQQAEENVQIVEFFSAKFVDQPEPELPSTLPTTASSLPLIAVLGFVSLAGAMILRYARTARATN
jgi:hypothetical protein